MKIRLIILGIAVLNLGFLVSEIRQFRDFDSPRLISLYTGNGDATLIMDSDTTILIDTGTSDDIVESVRKHLGFFRRTIDVLVITHPDRDHIGGTLGILQSYEVKKVLLTGTKESDDILYQEILQEIERKEIPVIGARAGVTLQSDQMDLEVLWPIEYVWGQEVDDANHESIVLQGRVGETELLLMGDLDIRGEQSLVQNGWIDDVDLLKAGHHGSKTSTGPILLSVAKPEVAIISAGKDNTFGHPHDIVIENLQDANVQIRQTAIEGDIVVEL